MSIVIIQAHTRLLLVSWAWVGLGWVLFPRPATNEFGPEAVTQHLVFSRRLDENLGRLRSPHSRMEQVATSYAHIPLQAVRRNVSSCAGQADSSKAVRLA